MQKRLRIFQYLFFALLLSFGVWLQPGGIASANDSAAPALTLSTTSGTVGTRVVVQGKAPTLTAIFMRFGALPAGSSNCQQVQAWYDLPSVFSDASGFWSSTIYFPAYANGATMQPGNYCIRSTSQTGFVQQDIFTVTPSPSGDTATCSFVLGFATLHSMIPTQVGTCLENVQYNPANGDALQHTTGGLLVWRKADNWTAFTDGYRTWINGPYGLQERLNSQAFEWEGPGSGAGSETIFNIARGKLAGYFFDIDSHNYARAYNFWESPPSSYSDFVAGYATTVQAVIQIGATSGIEGAAGSRYISFPVVIIASHTDGTRVSYTGCYNLRHVAEGVVPPGSPMLMWHIYSANVKTSTITQFSDPAAQSFLATPCHP